MRVPGQNAVEPASMLRDTNQILLQNLTSKNYLAAAARFIRNVVNNGTGRPVEPLAPPDLHAVPAISRCAQVYFLVKRSRKQAAVMLPTPGLPMLARSAKLDFSCSW